MINVTKKTKFILPLIFMFLLTACGKNPKDLPFIDDSGSSAGNQQNLDQLPANSTGVTKVVSVVDATISTITIPANKSYNPTVFNDGWFYFNSSAEFELPETVAVTNGRAGNHLLYVNLTRSSSPNTLPANLKCIYIGDESNTFADYAVTAKPYKFDFCVDEAVVVTPGTRASIKSSSANILDSTSRVGTLIDVLRSDKINVQVNNGNHKQSSTVQYITTSVEFVFDIKE
jgi:hypothetical protein